MVKQLSTWESERSQRKAMIDSGQTAKWAEPENERLWQTAKCLGKWAGPENKRTMIDSGPKAKCLGMWAGHKMKKLWRTAKCVGKVGGVREWKTIIHSRQSILANQWFRLSKKMFSVSPSDNLTYLFYAHYRHKFPAGPRTDNRLFFAVHLWHLPVNIEGFQIWIEFAGYKVYL